MENITFYRADSDGIEQFDFISVTDEAGNTTVYARAGVWEYCRVNGRWVKGDYKYDERWAYSLTKDRIMTMEEAEAYIEGAKRGEYDRYGKLSQTAPAEIAGYDIQDFLD